MNLRHRVSPSPVPSAFLSEVPTWRNSSEDGVLVLWRDADAGVFDEHLHNSVLGCCCDFDPPAFRCELTRPSERLAKLAASLTRAKDDANP